LSRAFVDEDAGSDESEGMLEIPIPLPAGAKNYMTSEGAARMVAELRALNDIDRPRAAAALAAALPADESESLRRLSEIDRRVSYLGRMKSALVVVDEPATAERVVFGLVARVQEEGGPEREYRIVGADESDPENGLLSWASPVARALVGKKVGDLAVATLPRGECRMRVLGIARSLGQ
jgi:transcription elongation factor GreB